MGSIVCETCGETFEPRAPHQRYCGRRCRNAANNRRRTPEQARGARRGRNAPRRRSKATGTQRWLTDPNVAVCRAGGDTWSCYWDADSCPDHGRF